MRLPFRAANEFAGNRGLRRFHPGSPQAGIGRAFGLKYCDKLYSSYSQNTGVSPLPLRRDSLAQGPVEMTALFAALQQ